MTLEVYSSSVDETVDSGFPKLRKAAEWVMWVLPAGPLWEDGEALRILAAFQDLRCVAWFASDGGEQTPTVKNHLRAFGHFAGPAKNVVVQRTLNYLSSTKTVYSDIGWFDSEHSESFASFLSRSTAGVDSTLSFIPANERSVENWSKAVMGLEWLWLLGNNKMTLPDAPLDPDAIVSAYVRLTIRIRGVAGLVFWVEGRHGLALFGDRQVLDAAARRITDADWQPTKSVFERWYRQGLHFRAAP